MPGGDQTGPIGMGAMTGMGAGYCGGSTIGGRGIRQRGWRCWSWFNRQPDTDEELRRLKSQSETMENQLKQLHSRIDELNGQR